MDNVRTRNKNSVRHFTMIFRKEALSFDRPGMLRVVCILFNNENIHSCFITPEQMRSLEFVACVRRT